MGQNENTKESEESLKAEFLLKFEWCRKEESNLRPTDYESENESLKNKGKRARF